MRIKWLTDVQIQLTRDRSDGDITLRARPGSVVSLETNTRVIAIIPENGPTIEVVANEVVILAEGADED